MFSAAAGLAASFLGGGVALALAQPVQVSGDPPASSATNTAPTAPASESSAAPSTSPDSPATSSTPSVQTPAQPAPAASASPTPDPGTAALEPGAPEHAASHPHSPPSGQGRRGFVVSAAFGVRPYFSQVIDGTTVKSDLTNSLQGGLAIGYKSGRVVFTVGLDIGAIDVRDTFTYRTTATFLIVPGLQVALARSRDQRVELIGSLRLGAGSTMSSDATSLGKPPALVMYEIAPAVRYWFHRQFSVQFLAGYGGEYQVVSGSTGNTSVGRHGLAASIGTIGIF